MRDEWAVAARASRTMKIASAPVIRRKKRRASIAQRLNASGLMEATVVAGERRSEKSSVLVIIIGTNLRRAPAIRSLKLLTGRSLRIRLSALLPVFFKRIDTAIVQKDSGFRLGIFSSSLYYITIVNIARDDSNSYDASFLRIINGYLKVRDILIYRWIETISMRCARIVAPFCIH